MASGFGSGGLLPPKPPGVFQGIGAFPGIRLEEKPRSLLIPVIASPAPG